MTDYGKIGHAEDPIIKMMMEGSGLWDITDERVSLISSNIGILSASGREAALEMLSVADSDQRMWVCKAEYYSLLHEIQQSVRKPTRTEVLEAIENVEKSSSMDRVDHREWVKSTILILQRLADEV